MHLAISDLHRSPWHPDLPASEMPASMQSVTMDTLLGQGIYWAASRSSAGMHSAVNDFNWGRYRRLIDVGGAYGSLLAALLARCPRSEGVLFDQPQARLA